MIVPFIWSFVGFCGDYYNLTKSGVVRLLNKWRISDDVRSFVRSFVWCTIIASPPRIWNPARSMVLLQLVVSVTKSGGTNTQQFARSFVCLVVCLFVWLVVALCKVALVCPLYVDSVAAAFGIPRKF